MSAVQSLNTFDFKATIGKEDSFIPLYARFMKVYGEQTEDIASNVFALLKKYNDPKKPEMAAVKMETYLDELVARWKDKEVEGVTIVSSIISRTGNSPFATAAKKIIKAVRLGADLQGTENTTSKCGKFAANRQAKKNEQEKLNKLTAEIRQEILEEHEADPSKPHPDTEEGKELLKQRVESMTASKDDKDKPIDDELSQKMKELEKMLRALGEAKGGHQSIEKITKFIKDVGETLSKIQEGIKQSLAGAA